MADITLTLGQFVFSDFEIPESIPFGGEQRLTVKKLVGGARVIDALGDDPVPLVWGGIFLGADALNRAMALKSMKESGQVFPLSWDQFSYKVIIQSFLPDYRKAYYIPYRIACEVVSDNTKYVATPPPNVTDVINADTNTATTICNNVGNSTLSTAMSTLSSAIAAVSDFAKATQAQINAVLQPLAAVQAQVSILIASTEKTLQNVTTVGGLLPNNPISQVVAKLGNYASASMNQPQLVQLSGVLGRIGVNIGQINSSVRTVTVTGGNLYDIASKQYGDATGWTAIAQANPTLNGDPQLSGITTLVIPAYTNNMDGIL